MRRVRKAMGSAQRKGRAAPALNTL
jgi:hypothetical protein